MKKLNFEEKVKGCLVGSVIGAELGFAKHVHPEWFNVTVQELLKEGMNPRLSGLRITIRVDLLIPLLIESGVNCIWPLEIAADMDPIKLRKKYGKDLVMCGGIDKRELAKDKKSIEKELNKIPQIIEKGGYIPHIDHTVPPDISYENFLYYLELKQKLCKT